MVIRDVTGANVLGSATVVQGQSIGFVGQACGSGLADLSAQVTFLWAVDGGGSLSPTSGESTTFSATSTGTFTLALTVDPAGSGSTPPARTIGLTVTAWEVLTAPTNVQATRGNTQATITWDPPTKDGGSPITNYLITSTPASPKSPLTVGNVLTATMTDLTNGTSYTFAVKAKTNLATGPSSSSSSAVTPATVPDAPTTVTMTAGNGQATVSWLAPSSNGGSAVLKYSVTVSPAPVTGATTRETPNATPSFVFTDLANGSDYFFTVRAINVVGTGGAAVSSASVTPFTVPGAPVIGVATPGNTTATVNWTAPAFNGGRDVTGYKITSSPTSSNGPLTVGNVLTTSMTGLGNGTAYTFTVQAINLAGTGAASAASNSVTPVGAPGAPTGVTGVAGSKQVTVSWSAPSSDGGSQILSYTVTSNPDSKTATVNGATLTAVVSGLTNGTGYTFTVKATNAFGTSIASTASATVTLVSLPGPPGFVTAVPGNTQATVSWLAPADTGGSSITNYKVTSIPTSTDSIKTVGNVLTTSMTGLNNGTSYTFTVQAVNMQGTGPASAASKAVKPAGVPGAPTGLSVVAGDKKATVTWTAGSDGGSVITGYTVTSDPDGKTATWSFGPLTATVTGLSNATAYTFKVKAKNAVGTGTESTASGAVTPTATVPGTPTVGAVTSSTKLTSVVLSVTAASPATHIRVTGGAGSAVEDAIVSSGVAQNVTVNLSTNVSNTLVVTAVNVAGAVASLPVTLVVVQDATAPSAPVVGAVASPTKIASLTLKVTAEVNSTARVKRGGNTLATATETGSPESITVTLVAGSNSLDVTAEDAALNTSSATVVAVTLDQTKPLVPVINSVTPSSPTNAGKVTLNITAETGSTVTVKGGASVAIASASTINVDVQLTPNVTNTLVVTAEDTAGNVSDPASVTVVSDNVAPVAPTVLVPPAFTKLTSINLTVTAEASSTIVVKRNGVQVTTAAGAGATPVSVPVALPSDGTFTLLVTAKDVALNESTAVERKVTRDTSSPAAPTVSTPTTPTSATSVTLSVTAAGEAKGKITVTVTASGKTDIVVTEVVTGSGQSITVPLHPQSSNTIKVKVTDRALNDSGEVTRPVVMNAVAPDPPVVSFPASPTKNSSVDLLVTFQGVNTVKVAGGKAAVSQVGSTSGLVTDLVTVTLTPNAANTLRITIVDLSSNVSAEVVRVVVQDSIQPVAPVVSPPASPTNSTSTTLAVTAEAGSEIRVTGGAVALVKAVATGSSQNVVVPLKLGSNTLTVRAFDAALNGSAPVSQSVFVDTAAPTPFTVDPVVSPTNNPTAELGVTTEASAVITVTGGASTVSKVSSGSKVTLAVGLNAGNVTPPVTVVIVLDTTAPSPFTISTPPSSTTASSIVLTVTVEKGAVVKVTGGSSTVTVTATGSSQSFPVSLTADATNVLVVKATDAAGNAVSLSRTVARTPAVTEIRGTVSATSVTGATAAATGGGTTRTVPVNTDGAFTIDKLTPGVSYTVKITGLTGGPHFFKAGASGSDGVNVTKVQGDATPITPGATGTFIAMSVRTPATFTNISGGGDNDVDRSLTIDGAALTGTTEVWLVSTTRTVKAVIVTVGATQVAATIEAGTPADTYNIQVRTAAGLSKSSAGTVIVTKAVVTLPVVTGLSQVSVVQGTSPVMLLTGTDLSGATAVTLNPGAISLVPTDVTAKSLKVTVPNTLATDTYSFKVTTAAGTGPASPTFEVRPKVDVSAVTEKQVLTDPVDPSSLGSGGLGAEVTLTNEGVQAEPGAAVAA